MSAPRPLPKNLLGTLVNSPISTRAFWRALPLSGLDALCDPSFYI